MTEKKLMLTNEIRTNNFLNHPIINFFFNFLLILIKFLYDNERETFTFF